MLNRPPHRWYAVTLLTAAGFRGRERAHTEFSVCERLRAEGVEAHAPAIRYFRKVSRYGRRREMRYAPALPGYLLINAPEPPRREALQRWPRVLSVVRRGIEPAVILADHVEPLLDPADRLDPLAPLRFDHAGIPRPGHEVECPALQPGDRVHLRGDGWHGQVAEVEAVKRDQAVVLIELLGSMRRARVRVHDVVQVAR